ncbi:hypothetical protein BC936DRAFT_143709 [Jimgerdemannia flammicorona]|uniref:Uncharacterized protein n=1 Tax=Jimgerdemannia flammicorona TaxID=994334 RepID=A0A433DDH2_9FUNG|nr:hypothetical protein BC936DRAFT_143709 [Jimgerdemannia flammicorona]
MTNITFLCTIYHADRFPIPQVFNGYLTFLFIRPLIIGNVSNSNSFVSRITRRTFVASTTCLIASAANILVLALIHGEERDFVCLGLCSFDVTLNVATVHWVTTSTGSNGPSNKALVSNSDLERNQSSPDKESEVYIMDQNTFDMRDEEK